MRSQRCKSHVNFLHIRVAAHDVDRMKQGRVGLMYLQFFNRMYMPMRKECLAKTELISQAHDRPGNPSRWAHGSQMAVGTSISPKSLVRFTLGRGVLNEVFYPRVDSPCLRELYFVVIVNRPGSDPLFSDERVDTEHLIEWLGEGVPGFNVTSTSSKKICYLNPHCHSQGGVRWA